MKKKLRILGCTLVVMTIAFVGYSNEESKSDGDITKSNIEVLAGERGFLGIPNNCPGHSCFCSFGGFWNSRQG